MKKAAQATPNQRLKQERERRCWSQLEVADQIGTTSLNVSRWERGITFPTPHFRQELCTLFGKSAIELGLLQEENADPESMSEPGVQLPQQEVAVSQTKAEAERLWNVPFGRNPFFTGRESLLQRLHEQLHKTQRASLNQSQALTGLGGIGKTQLACEYAFRYRVEYTAVFWVRAASRETLIADFVALARLLDLPGQSAQEEMLVVEEVKRWLGQHAGWLLILDNADELPLVKDFLSTKSQGHVLLTTRAQATGKIAESLPVERLEPSESMQLLLRRAKVLAHDEPLDNVSRAVRTSAQALVEELDGLPLALDQVGAYIEETGCSLAEYLALYRRRRLALLKRQSSISADYPHSVASTWSLSFEKVEHANPAAAELLRFCSFLYPDAIPEAFLSEGAGELGPLLEPLAADDLLLNEAIQLLRGYSLIKRDAEARLLVIHRLVQIVLRDGMEQQAQRQWAERTVRTVNRAFPEVEFATWGRCEGCLPHALACAALIDEHHLAFPEAARLLDRAGYYLQERGLYGQAEPLFECALAVSEKTLGPDHPDTATILYHLAELNSLHGKFEQAEALFLRALAIREQALGPEHLQTADIRSELAWLYHEQGRYAQAEPLYQRALAIREQTLGPRHRVVGESLNDLAGLYTYQGKFEQAEPLYKHVLAIFEQTIGPDHPDTAHIINNLANNYNVQGKYESAEPLYHRALAIREQQLGSEHPHTGVTLCDLARCYTLQGKYEQAEPLFQHALAVFEKVFSPEHRNIAFTLNYLAELYQAQGKYGQAEPPNQRALAICEQALGPDHPRTATILNNLAHLYFMQGKYEQAEPIYQRALAIRQLKLGDEHPDVARSLHHLAELYVRQGKYEQAEPLYQRALVTCELKLGPEHPITINIRKDYTELLHTMQGPQTVTPQWEAMPPG